MSKNDITIKYLCDRAREDFPEIIKQEPMYNINMMMVEYQNILTSEELSREKIFNAIYNHFTTFAIIILAQSYYSAETNDIVDKFNDDVEFILSHLKTCNEVSKIVGANGLGTDKDSLERFSGLVNGFTKHSNDIDELFNKDSEAD